MTKTIIKLLLFVTIVFTSASTAEARVYIDLAAPAAKKLQFALPLFAYSGLAASKTEAEAARSIGDELAGAVVSDLDFTGLFKMIDRKSYPTDKDSPAHGDIAFADWRSIGAETLIKGSYNIEKDSLTLEIRVYDCAQGTMIFGKKYIGSAANPRRTAHYFANQMYEEFTGEKGIFTTKITFVSNKTGAKEVYVADFDGRNPAQITRNRSINLFPQWLPDGKRLMYTSYKTGWPCLFTFDLRTGKDTVISDKKGLNIGGRVSPDGRKAAMTLSITKASELFVKDLVTGELKQITESHGINVSPSWSPDGKSLVYSSDSSGNTNIFVLSFDGTPTKRLTFSGKYNASPVWSPDGKKIAFAKQEGGNFNIWVMSSNGANAVQLTYEGSNESPSWSPDGKHIIFSSARRGASSLYIMRGDGTGTVKLATGVGNEQTPAWSPYMQ